MIFGLFVAFIVFAHLLLERWATKKIAFPKEEYLKSKPQMSNLKTEQNPNQIKKNQHPNTRVRKKKSIDKAFTLLSSFYAIAQWHLLSSKCKGSIT